LSLGLLLFATDLAAEPSTLTFSQDHRRDQVFGLELEYLGRLETSETVDLQVTCLGETETPALKLHTKATANTARLINTTASDYGCSSFLIEALSGDGASVDTLSVGIAVDRIAQRELGRSSIFVFNPVHGMWTQAEEHKPNQADPTKAYASLTTKSVQAITGVIVMPDLPTPGPLSEGQLSETLGDVNPIQGLMGIPRVEPDSRGQVSVDLPLLLRPSRGPGPSFKITNSPDLGIGDLGRGWSLEISKIHVRGPSPIYHPDFETEDYLLDGQELIALDADGRDIPPLYKGGPILPRVDGVRVFRPRNSTEPLIVRRYGDGPQRYFWEVWNPGNQTTRLYGGILDGDKIAMDPQSVLTSEMPIGGATRTASGVWGLSQEFDNQPARSGARYYYHAENKDRTCSIPSQGCVQDLRIERISYNEAFGVVLTDVATSGVTQVDFVWRERARERYTSDARLGFLRFHQYWLERVDVHYEGPSDNFWLTTEGAKRLGLNPPERFFLAQKPTNQTGLDLPKQPQPSRLDPRRDILYSRHEFALTDGEDQCMNFDQVLRSVTVSANGLYNGPSAGRDLSGVGQADQSSQTFEFSYDGEKCDPEADALLWQEHSLDNPLQDQDAESGIGFPNELLSGLGLGVLTDASLLGESNTDETGASIYVGVGPNGDTSDKSISGGAKAGHSFIQSRSGSTLIDVTGDGIDDIVRRTSTGLEYCAATRAQDGSVSYPSDPNRCGRPVFGLNDIAISSSSTESFGVEGFVPNGFFGVGYNSAVSSTYVYFTDRDGDGLIDVVVYGRVLYGQGESCPTPTTCFVKFSPESALTPPLPGLAGEATARDILEQENRKPPGFPEAIDQMAAALSELSDRLDRLSYSQTSVAWEAPLTGSLAIAGQFRLDASAPTPQGDGLLANGLRRFAEIRVRTRAFLQYVSDCEAFPDSRHCPRPGMYGPESRGHPFAFPDVPAAVVRLEITRSRRADAVGSEYSDKLEACGERTLPRGGVFDISQLLIGSPCARHSDEKGWLLDTEAGDVLYLSYSVHPDFTGSLQPDARYEYKGFISELESLNGTKEINLDPAFNIALRYGDYSVDEVYNCTWRDQFSRPHVETDCLLNKQDRYSFAFATGLLTSNPRAAAQVPRGSDRAFVGEFEISTALTRDYQISLDVNGSPAAAGSQRAADLPLMFRHDITEACSAAADTFCRVRIEPICVTDQAICNAFLSDDADPWRIALSIRTQHKENSLVEAINLNSRLTSLRWIAPPRLVSEITEVQPNAELPSKEKPYQQRQGIVIEGTASKVVSIYLPISFGDPDVEHRRVTHGTFAAPNPELNEGSPSRYDIAFEKIISDENTNVDMAQGRQLASLCGFAEEILRFLEERGSSSLQPFIPSRIDYWRSVYAKSELVCFNEELHLQAVNFTGRDGPEPFLTTERLKLREVLRHLPYEEQLSSAETLLSRVLKNLELPRNALTSPPLIAKSGYRLPVKANPLDCGTITSTAKPVEGAIYEREALCSYRFLMNFAMEDILRLFPDQDNGKPHPNRVAYERILAQFLKSETPAFDLELSLTVNGVPTLIAELTGSKASNVEGDIAPTSPLKQTCIGSYGAHGQKWPPITHFHPDPTGPNAGDGGDIFQRIVTNRRPGRVVAFSDDVMHSEVPGTGSENGLGKYSDLHEMEAKQDCDEFDGDGVVMGKYVGPPTESVAIRILENNRIVGRNRIFEFEARPLDIVEFHVRLRPREQIFATISPQNVPFNLDGKFSVLNVQTNATSQILAGDYIVPRSPSQIVPPNLDPVDCGIVTPILSKARPLPRSCRPWTRIAWSELLLGAEYRTYSDGHKTINDKEFSIKRRREILRVFPEIEVAADEFRLEWDQDKDHAPIAGGQYMAPATAYSLGIAQRVANPEIQIIEDTSTSEGVVGLRNFISEFGYLQDRLLSDPERVSFIKMREPNLPKIGGSWLIWAQRSSDTGALSSSPTFTDLRYALSEVSRLPEDPRKRFDQAVNACIGAAGSDNESGDFEGCEKDTKTGGRDALSFKLSDIFPLEHRFLGPVHETQETIGVNQLIAETDICAVPTPNTYASCWSGQDDTVFIHRAIGSAIQRDNPSGEHQTTASVESVSALIGLEQPLIEQFKFELDAVMRVACNDSRAPADHCAALSPSPERPDTEKFAQIHSATDFSAPLKPVPLPPAGAAVSEVNPINEDVMARAPPAVPNRPNPPEPSTALHVFAPVQGSRSQSVSRNIGVDVGGLSFNTNTVFNSSRTTSLFVDINGDGYPEVLTGNGVLSAKLTSPVGLLREDWWRYFSSRTASNPEPMGPGTSSTDFGQSSDSISRGAGFGLSPPTFAQIYQKSMDAVVSPSFDLSFESGEQTKFLDLKDFNGDGILDLLSGGIIGDNVRVQLNLGNSLLGRTDPIKVGEEGIYVGDQLVSVAERPFNTTHSTGFGVRLGFDINSGSIKGGMGLGTRVQGSEGVVMDFTGDGRSDIVVPISTGGKSYIGVFPNLGNGFLKGRLHEIQNWGGSESTVGETTLVDAGSAFTFGVNLLYVKIVFNPAVKRASNQTRELLNIRDVNGDGVPDLARVSGVFKNAGDGSVSVPDFALPGSIKTSFNYNPDAKYHLLTGIVSPTGVQQEISYALNGNTGPELGRSIWVADRVSEFDGYVPGNDRYNRPLYGDGQDVRIDLYSYEDGYFNRAERTFYGFSEVKASTFGCDRDGGQPCDGVVSTGSELLGEAFHELRQVLRQYQNRDFLTRGSLTAEVMLGASLTEVADASEVRPRLEATSIFEIAAARRVGYAIEHLESLGDPATLACEAPGVVAQARWYRGLFTEGSALPSKWASASSSNSNLDGAAVLGDEALCAKDLRACHAILAERTCKSGFWLEQVQFWAQQGGSMRPRFFDLHIPAPGLPISSETKITEISIRPTDALYSASGADFDQWGQAVTSYSIGDVDMRGIPVNGSSFYGRTTYAGRNGLSATVQKSAGDGSKEYPIASLAAAETVMQGPWPQGPDEDPLRMREALYEGSSADVGTRANLTDICLYPARSDQDGFSYREGICEDFKGSMRKGLSDGLSSFGDAQRSAYSVQGLPAGTRRFSAIQHWQFSKHDPFGNITEVVSPLTDKAEWLEHRYDYRRDPFLLTPTFLETTRCVQDIVGAGESSPSKPPEATGTCGFNVGYDSDTDERTAVTHWSLQRIDPHHGLVGGSRDVNGNHLLLDFDQWGRFRLLARDWGEAPRQNKAFMADIDLATLKSEFPVATGRWNILGVANYGWPSSVENAFSSHTQMFASSNAYGGASGTFDAIRNSATFTDGVGKLVQSSVEAEVCNGADPNLLASINSNPRRDIDEQCAETRSSRVNSGEFVDVLGREFAAFEGFSSDSGQHTLGPVFMGLAAPDHQEAPLSVRSLDGGDRLVKQQHRLAAKGLTTIETGVLATTQFAYGIGEAEYLGQSVNRFRTLVVSPRCALTASYTDPRGLTTSAVESQDTLYRAADYPFSMDSSNTYQRDYSTTAGHCLPIEDALLAWNEDDSSAANATVNYSFDPLLQLTGVEYPLAGGDRASIFADYDRIGRMTELRDPDSGCARYQFDNLNNLTERTGFAYESDLKTPCGVTLQPSEIRRFEYAADRVISMTYRSLEQKAGAEDVLDAVSFFHDRYPHTTAFGELLETPRAVPNDQANQRFFDVTGKICENCVGQVTMIADRSGARSFNFSELGQIKRETRSIVAPVWDMVPSEGNPEAFQPEVAFYELENSYSSFGDLTLQEFNESVPTNPSNACNAEGPESCAARFSIGTRYAPDGSVAALLFNGQPLVQSVKDGINRPAVRLMSDGTVTGFFYDPVDLRLNQMATITAAQAGDFHVPVQITGYQYDGGGNIAGYQNVAAIRENYRSHFNFTYDGANRLTGFDAFARKNAETLSASGTFSFDLGHRITGRELTIEGDPGSSFMRRWSYAYDNTPSPRQPVHAPMSIAFNLPHLEATRVSALEYDEVGRLAKVRTAENGKAPGVMSDRRLDWDGAGRLRRVQGGPDDYWTDNSDVLREEYVYDYAGNRVLKIDRPVLGEGGAKTEAEITSIYMTPFYSRPADGRGTVQLASGDLPVASLTPPVSETAEPMVTYLYPDLAVGTVTASVLALGEITDANSTLIARREYEPFGLELTANKLAAPEDPMESMPSVFHGKELDRTTGFSSFGARYYSRDLGFWASPDPMQMSYLFGGPAGGVYAPRNMSTYAFAGQNPITASDASGEFLDIVLDVGFIAYDVGALAYDEFKTGGVNRSENLAALAADIAGAAVPFATGGGIAVRGGIKVVDKGTDVAKVGQKAVKEAAENVGKYVTAPKTLDAFASAQRERPKTPVQGGGGMRARWKDEKGRIFEWDYRHGNVEVYSKRGKHIGEFDPKTGVQTKPANPRRIVEP
jgi:RHS repeat-associated protein